MKSIFLTIAILIVSWSALAQEKQIKGARFSLMEEKEASQASFYSSEDSSDVLLEIYDAVLFGRLNLYLDSSLLGNPVQLIQIPSVRHFYSRHSGEIRYSIEKIDYLTNVEQSDIPLMDENGVTMVVEEDGLEYFVYPENIESPLNATHTFQLRILEEGKYNVKRNKWNYSLEAIGIELQSKAREIAWIKWKDLKKAIQHWEDYPILRKIESESLNTLPYKQTGPNHVLDDSNYKIRRTLIRNVKGNETLFKQTNCSENSTFFLDQVFSMAGISSQGYSLNKYMCVQNENWYYPFLSDQFKEFVSLTYPRDEVNCPVLAYAGEDSMFNNAYHDIRFFGRGEMAKENYVVELFIHPSEIVEIHLEEVKVLLPDGTYSDFKIKSLAFVLDFQGEKREIFSIKMSDLIFENEDKDWYSFLINRRYVGEQFWQGVDDGRMRF